MLGEVSPTNKPQIFIIYPSFVKHVQHQNDDSSDPHCPGNGSQVATA